MVDVMLTMKQFEALSCGLLFRIIMSIIAKLLPHAGTGARQHASQCKVYHSQWLNNLQGMITITNPMRYLKSGAQFPVRASARSGCILLSFQSHQVKGLSMLSSSSCTFRALLLLLFADLELGAFVLLELEVFVRLALRPLVFLALGALVLLLLGALVRFLSFLFLLLLDLAFFGRRYRETSSSLYIVIKSVAVSCSAVIVCPNSPRG